MLAKNIQLAVGAVRKIPLTIFGAALCVSLMTAPVAQAAPKEVKWTVTDGRQMTELYEKVRNAMTEIHQQELDDGGGLMRIRAFIALALIDIDKDGKKEVLAHAPADMERIYPGYPGDPYVIFKVGSDGSLSRIWTGQANGLMLGDGYTQGKRNLVILKDLDENLNQTNAVSYRWNGTTYETTAPAKKPSRPNPYMRETPGAR